MAHAEGQHVGHAEGQRKAHAEGQQHPLGIYLKIWGLLFILSTASSCRLLHIHGYLRWFLILTFMLLKARRLRCRLHAYALGALALVYAIWSRRCCCWSCCPSARLKGTHLLYAGTFFGTGSEVPVKLIR
jgi:cytochrome c oxidase subunit IV